MADSAQPAATGKGTHNAVLAGFLGWTFDAFDFFVLTFVLAPIAAEFGKTLPAMALTITASLATRWLGAILFGLLADRYGRRIPLIANILYYSLIEVLSGLAPNYRVFFVLRLLYGIGMGGEWGVGASLTMESIPAKWRGLVSGFLQEGYALGFLLAAGAYRFVYPHWGWRPLFFVGGLPALLTLFVQHQHSFTPERTSYITAFAMVGAICGGLGFGYFSDRKGRRRAMVTALLLGCLLIPMWVFAPNLPLILAGGFLMQFMVQGAWGVIPAHINELSPDALRGFFPGLAYQFGVLVASGSAYFEARMAHSLSYGRAMGLFALIVLIVGAIVVWLGPEEHRVEFGRGG